MSSVFLSFLFFIWALGAMIGFFFDAAVDPDTSSFNAVIQFDVFREFTIDLPGVAPLRFPFPNPDFFRSILALALWDSSLWSGAMASVRFILPLALTFGFVVTMLIQFFTARLSR